jgi:hypothetical protein
MKSLVKILSQLLVDTIIQRTFPEDQEQSSADGI